MASMQSAADSNDHQWTCSTCTFLNHPALEKCECCESPRAVSPRQVCESDRFKEQPDNQDDGLPGVRNLENNFDRTNSQQSYGVAAAEPTRTRQMQDANSCPTEDPDRTAREDYHDEPPHRQPHFDVYTSSGNEAAENPEAMEMTGFLPTLSPEDIELSEQPRTMSVRVTHDDVMETLLDAETPTAENSAIGSAKRASFELATTPSVDVAEAGGLRGAASSSFTSRILHRLKEPSKRFIIITFFVVLAIIVFLGVFPPSFVYLDYGHVALKQTKSTGYVNTKDVVYPGCHVLGPDIKLKVFNSTALTLDFASVSSFLADQMEVSFDCNLQYFIRQESVGKLHEMFAMDFEPVIKRVAYSTLKMTTTKFSLVNIRLNRSYVEKTLHRDLQQKLGGDCCPICCEDTCKNHPTCLSGCNNDRSSCYPGYHVDIRYFNFGAIVLPSQLTTRLLKIALLHVKADTEHFKHDHALAEKETQRQVALVMNEAAEIKNRADTKAAYITRVASASAFANKGLVDMHGLRDMCSVLGISDAEQKLSVYMLKTFNKMDGFLAPGWMNASTYTGQGFG